MDGGRDVLEGWRSGPISERSQKGQVKVHEIAREMSVSSNEVLAALSDIGEFAKSGVSAVDAPVARDVRAHMLQRRAPASRSGSIRIYALTKEIGISAERIVTALSRVGIYGKGRDSLIEAPEARWVRHHFGVGRRDAGKVRVHELAKEFGVTSKDVLSALKDHGYFVISASSTVSPSAEARIRHYYSVARYS